MSRGQYGTSVGELEPADLKAATKSIGSSITLVALPIWMIALIKSLKHFRKTLK